MTSACQNAVASALSPWSNWYNLRQRLREWLYDGGDRATPCQTELDVTLCFAPLLRWVLCWWRSGGLALAIDPTLKGDQTTAIVISVLYRSCAIPVAWHIRHADQPGSWMDPTVELLQALAPAVPENMTVIVLCDRGIASPKLWQQIRDQGWHPGMRYRKNITFCADGGKRLPAQRFVSRPDTAWIGRGTAFSTPKAQRRCTLLVVWYSEQEEPWIILTDLAPDQVGPSWYALRFWIELGFKALKSLGWKWDQTRRTDPTRVSRHWLVLSVATLLALAYGTRVEDAQERRIAPGNLRAPPKALAPNHRDPWSRPARTVSVIRHGIDWLRRLLLKGRLWRRRPSSRESASVRGLPLPVGDEAVIAVGDEEGQLGTERGLHPPDDEPHRRGVGLTLEGGVRGLGHIGGAVHPVGNRRPVRLGYGLDEIAQAFVPDGDGKAHVQLAADGYHAMSVEAAVGPHRELSAGSAVAHPPHRFTQEVGGAASGVGPALTQPRHQHLPGASGHGQQRVIAPLAGVAVMARALLGQTIGFADGGVQVDGQRPVAGSGTGSPGPGQQLAAHPIQLADVAPPEAAQERPQGRWRLDHTAQNPSCPAGAQRVVVVDAVAPSQTLPPRKRGAEATRVMILSPVLALPGASPRSRSRSTSWGRPRCWARVAGRISPALSTRRWSSKEIWMWSGWLRGSIY